MGFDIAVTDYEKLKNKPTPLFLSLINDAAESRYEAALAQEAYDDVLFDVFANSNKISSSTDVDITTGTGGNIKLTNWPSIDDFEDGDVSDWTGDTGSFSAQSATVISGTYTGEFNSSNASNWVTLDFTDFSDPFKFKVQVGSDTGSSGDYVGVKVFNPAGDYLFALQFNDTGNLNEDLSSTEILASWSANTTYTIKIDPNFSADTADIYVDGNLEASGVPFYNSSSEVGKIEFWNITQNSTATRSGYIDDIEKGTGYVSIGSFTSVHKVLGYTPNKLMIIDEQTLNGEDIEFEVYNSSGTKVKTITQSDLNSEVSLDVTDTEFYIKGILSQTGGNTPELSEYGILFV